MFDVSVITTLLVDDWTETDPAVANITFTTDEFDKNNPKLQILCENIDLPKEEYLVSTLFKLIQPVRISVYLKPTNFKSDVISANKVTFYKALNEVDKIIRASRFTATATEYNGIQWRNVIIPKGFGTMAGVQPEPIVFKAEKLLTVQSYIGGA
jgi:hypothetical protein